MNEFYRISVAGLERDLPVCRINDEISIAAFIIFGDVELTVNCARELLKKAPPHDILITAEAKGIPLIHEMARQSGMNKYIVARKAPKLYMKDVVSIGVKSISTEKEQRLSISGADAALMKGRRVLFVDDVISTGGSMFAVEELIRRVGGEIVGRMAILAEGDAIGRKDIIYLEKLPLLDKNGEPM